MEKEQFDNIFDKIMDRNVKLVFKCNIIIIILGLFFFLLNLLLKTENLAAYWVLIVGSIALYLYKLFMKKMKGIHAFIYCYALLATILVFGMILSIQPTTINMPSTSFIAFLAFIPLIVNDKPTRMGMLILLATLAYFVISLNVKTGVVFKADVMNTMTFSVLGIVLYISISNRSVKEIFYWTQAAEN